MFGFFNVSARVDGELVTDLQDDVIEPAELEKATYEFVRESREGGVMHKGEANATLVESMVFTPEKLQAMGLEKTAVPTGWWGGFHVHDQPTFEKVKDGTLAMFSIEGTADRVAA